MILATAWLTRNQDAILAGIVSSAIVLAAQTLVRTASLVLFDFILRRPPVRRLWGFKKPRRIHVISGSIERLTEGDGLSYLAAPDAEAAAMVTVALRNLYPRTEIVHLHSPTFSPDLYGSDVVTVGGPVNNLCTRRFLEATPAGVRFDGLDLVTNTTRYTIGTSTNGAAAGSDFGLIVAGPNPYGAGTRYVVLAGCDTHGVLAAATSICVAPSGRKVQRAIRRSQGLLRRFARGYEYYAVVEGKVIANVVGQPTVREAVRVRRAAQPPETRQQAPAVSGEADTTGA